MFPSTAPGMRRDKVVISANQHWVRIMNVSYRRLLKFSEEIFLKIGLAEYDAITASLNLLSADLRGVDSHGVARLSGYVRLWDAGRINSKAKPFIIHESPTTASVNGDEGLGLVVADYAMKVAIQKAEKYGSGWVSVQNSSHFGIAGIHAMQALEKDMIGMAFTNASPLVSPTFSTGRMLGTNPIAVAIPAGEQPPFVADFATTTAANGKLEIAQRLNKEVPNGWVQTKFGEPSTNPHELKEGGSLLPLGSDREHASHKGFMLGSIVDIFSGVLSGANFGPFVPPFPAYVPMPSFMPGKGIGHFFGAMRIDGFRPADNFKRDMDLWISEFRKAPAVDPLQPVVIPGDPEREAERERREKGIFLEGSVVEDLNLLAGKFGLDLL